MAKRHRDEPVEAADLTENGVKKPKLKEEKKKEKKREKSSRESPAGDTNVAASEEIPEHPVEGVTDTATLSKAERKALKRAKKEQDKAAQQGSADAEANGTEAKESAAKAERKARRRAEKEARLVNGNKSPEDHPVVSNGARGASGVMTPAAKATAEAYYKKEQIVVEDAQKQEVGPILTFDALAFDEDLRKQYFGGFAAPTPIQAASWPYLIKGRDLIGVAETGSGKTFAFGVPCIDRLKDKKRIQVCIVSPTRELALQIQEQMDKLGKPRGLGVTCVYGGVSKEDQRRQLKSAQIVVATPGRLNDFIGDGTIDLSHVRYLVLDEADRMLDKGFEQDIRKIVTAAAPGKDRQTVMFTATWPPSVRDLAAEFLRDPVRITIGDNASGELRANTRIAQEVEVIEEFDKQSRLIELLKQHQSGKNKKDRILVFCLYKKEATRIEEFIRRRGFPVAGIHGDLSQAKRTESLEAFRQGQIPLLVATDVAARGLDIPAVKLVLNVTFPLTVEDYVHRIGRTGRAGQNGRAITFFTQTDKALSGALINVLRGADQPVPEELLKFGTTVKKKGHDAYGAFFRDTADMKQATKITFD